MAARVVLILESFWSFEKGLIASIDDEGHEPAIRIQVSEDQAVDIYNQSFACKMHLSIIQATQLRDWLSAAIEEIGKIAP